MEPPSHIASQSPGTTRYWQSMMESYFHPLSPSGEPGFTGCSIIHPKASAAISSSLLTTIADQGSVDRRSLSHIAVLAKSSFARLAPELTRQGG